MNLEPKLIKSILIQLNKATPKSDSLTHISARPGQITLAALRDPGLTQFTISVDHEETWDCSIPVLYFKKLLAKAKTLRLDGVKAVVGATAFDLKETTEELPEFLDLPETVAIDGEKFSAALTKIKKLGKDESKLALMPSAQGPRLTGYTSAQITTALVGQSEAQFDPFVIPSDLQLPKAIGSISIGVSNSYMEIGLTAKLTGGEAQMRVVERGITTDGLPDVVSAVSAGTDDPVIAETAQLKAGLAIAKAYEAIVVCLSYNPLRGMRLEVGAMDSGTFYHKIKAHGTALWEIHLMTRKLEKIISGCGKHCQINVSTYEGLPIIRVTFDGIDQYLIGAKARKDPRTPLLTVKTFAVNDGAISLNKSQNRIRLEVLPDQGEITLTREELMNAKLTGQLESVA